MFLNLREAADEGVGLESKPGKTTRSAIAFEEERTEQSDAWMRSDGTSTLVG